MDKEKMAKELFTKENLDLVKKAVEVTAPIRIDEKRVNEFLEELREIVYPKDKFVVLSREEYERLSSSHDIVFCDNKGCPYNLLCSCCEISECPRNIPEYDKKLSVNKHKLELFQKLCKERERADSWEYRYKLLQEELKQTSKETAEKIGKDLMYVTLLPNYAIESYIKTYIKQKFGVEIKESVDER